MSQANLFIFVLALFLFSYLLVNLNRSQVQDSLTWELQNIEGEAGSWPVLHYLSTWFYTWAKKASAGRGSASHHQIQQGGDDDGEEGKERFGGEKGTTSPSFGTSKTDTNSIPLAPDLSTCHKSVSRGGQPCYCCPPRRESEEEVIDFQFPGAGEPRRIRRPAHVVANDQEYLARYEKAIAIMKQYPYEDPFNWMRQANMHCIYCTGAYDQLNSSALFNVHRSWLFFPWHRFFIYFHERFIGKLIGDDTFALPYWNWDHPDGMVIPEFYYRGAFVDDDRQRSHRPPTVVDDSFNRVEKGLTPEEQVASNLAFMYNQMVSGAKKAELFMGCRRRFGTQGECNGPGTIEAAPHNTLHTWVGNPELPERENMGSFYSAARDPIFYAHHANIDRLWTVWKQLRGGQPEFVDPVWLDSYFYFHNENRQLVRVKIRDCLDIHKLGYVYQHADLPWLHACPKPSIPPKIARSLLKMRESQLISNSGSTALLLPTFSSDFGSQGRALDAVVRAKVYRSPKHKPPSEEEVLVVYGIDIKEDMYVKFDVFVNAIDELRLGPQAREFAGTFVNARDGARIVLKDGSSPAMGKVTLKLGISELLRDLEADDDDSIWVTLVPKGGTGVNTTVGGIRIEYM